MPIVVTCSHCAAPLSAPDEAAGRTLRCPACMGTTVAPGRRARPVRETTGGLALAAVVGAGGLAAVAAGVWWFSFGAAPEVAAPAVPAPPEPARVEPAPKPPPQIPVRPVTPATKPSPPTITPPPRPKPTAREPVRLEPRAKFTPGTPKFHPVYLNADGSRAVVRAWYPPGSNYKAEVWELNPAPKKLREFAGSAVSLSDDGTRVVCTDTRNGTDVIDVDTGKAVCTLRPGGALDYFFVAPDLIAGARRLPRDGAAKDDYPERLEAYDARTGRLTGGFDLPVHPGAAYHRALPGGANVLVGWPVAPRVEVWDIRKGERVSAADLPNPLKITPWRGFQTSPDGRRMTTTAGDLSGRAVVSDVTTGAELAALPGVWLETVLFVPGKPELVLAMSQDWAAYGLTGSGWVAYHLGRREVVATFPGAEYFADVSADGRVLATKAGYDTPDVFVYDLTKLP